MDYYLKATAAGGQLRVFIADTRLLVDKASFLHQTSPVAAAALGRTLTAASIMGLMTGNEDDLVTISIKGNGPLGGVLASSDGLGNVRGYCHNPLVIVPNKPNGKLDVAAAIGRGTITVMKDLGLREPYSGSLELYSGEIAEDVAQYFMISEQTPSIVSLGVLIDTDHSIKSAGGFLLQAMPYADEELLIKLESKMDSFPSITSLMEGGKKPEGILDLLLSDFGYVITERGPLEYRCTCNRGRVRDVLTSIGEDELRRILSEDGGATLDCHFCRELYHFSTVDLLKILSDMI